MGYFALLLPSCIMMRIKHIDSIWRMTQPYHKPNISGVGLPIHKLIINAAIAANVRIFFPPKHGVDTSAPNAPEVIPTLKPEVAALSCLNSKQDQISWTALVTGSLFNWIRNIPPFGGIDLPPRTATIYDTSYTLYEVTTLDRLGEAIATALKYPELIKNQYVYVNNFTVTQTHVISTLEKLTGDRFAILSHDSVKDLRERR